MGFIKLRLEGPETSTTKQIAFNTYDIIDVVDEGYYRVVRLLTTEQTVERFKVLESFDEIMKRIKKAS